MNLSEFISSGGGGIRNKLLNGDFKINQRSYVSGAATAVGAYTLDRWKVTATSGVTFSTTAGKVTLTIPAGQTIQQVIEGINIEAGDYVLSWEGTAQGRIDAGAYGASGSVKATLAGGSNVTVQFNAGTVTQIMLEKGSNPTQFEHLPHALQLAMCQRYYYRAKGVTNTILAPSGVAITAANVDCFMPLPVQMRIAPTAIETTGSNSDYVTTVGGTAVTAGPSYNSRTSSTIVVMGISGSSFTVGNGAFLRANTANAYIGVSAEL